MLFYLGQVWIIEINKCYIVPAACCNKIIWEVKGERNEGLFEV